MPGFGTGGRGGGQVNLAGYVKRTDLEGHEGDVFGAYQSAAALLDDLTTNRIGSWSIATNTSGAPTEADWQNQGQITSGTATFVMGALWSTSAASGTQALDASDYPAGTVLHVIPWDPYSPDNHLRVVLDVDATLVDTGAAAYIWATCTLVEVGDIQDSGDFYRISHEAPSQLAMDLPADAIGNPLGFVHGTTDLAPAGALAVSGGTYKTWERSDMRAHLNGPDTRTLTIANFERTLSTPSTAGRIYISDPVGGLRQVNITWGNAAQLENLLLYMLSSEALGWGSWRARITADKPVMNTVAHGGFQFAVEDLPGSQAPAAVGQSQPLTMAGRIPHWGDSEFLQRLVPQNWDLGSLDDVGTSYTNLATGLGNDWLLAVTFQENAGDKRSRTVVYKFGDIPTSGRWVMLKPSDGSRFQLKRSNQNLQVLRSSAVESDNNAYAYRIR